MNNHNGSSSSPTLADVLERLQDIGSLSDQARRNMVSSIRTLCRVIDRAPRFVVATPPALRTVFREASPGVEDLSPSRWANVKSDVRRAVRMTGALEDAVEEVPLSGNWEELVALELDTNRRCALRRFGRFCSARQCEPSEVNDEVVKDFHQHLDATGLSKTPERIVRDLIRFWTVLSDREGLDLPLLDKRSRDNRYSFAWEDLPAALAKDARAFREARVRPSPFEDMGRPVRRTTADKQHRMLLLDEPLSNLDAKLRIRARAWLKDLQSRLGITTIYVTHDQVEALSLSDRIAVMDGGRLVQVGTPAEIYSRPVSPFVADFIGASNFLKGRVTSAEAGFVAIEMAAGRIVKAMAMAGVERGASVQVAIRPENIVAVNGSGAPEGFNVLEGVVRGRDYLGARFQYLLDLGGDEVRVEIENDISEQQLQIAFSPENCIAFPIEG